MNARETKPLPEALREAAASYWYAQTEAEKGTAKKTFAEALHENQRISN
jgi:hypothetical protein